MLGRFKWPVIFLITLASFMGVLFVVLIVAYINESPQFNFTHTKHTSELIHIKEPGVHKKKPVNVLVISGGGIDGVLPAVVLSSLEKRIGHPLYKSIDLFVGTSIGAMICSYLDSPSVKHISRPHTAMEIVRMMRKNGPKILHVSPWRRVLTLDGLTAPLSLGLEKEAMLKKNFGNLRMKDMLKPAVFVGFDVENLRVLLLNNFNYQHQYGSLKLSDVISAVTAVPGMFAPYPLILPGEQVPSYVIDGAVVSNTPEMLAYIEARRLFPGRAIRIISLGSGDADSVLRPDIKKINSLGSLTWLGDMVDLFIKSSEMLHSSFLTQLVKLRHTQLIEFYRFDMADDYHFKKNVLDASPGHIHYLNQLAHGFVREHQKELEELAVKLR